ncbi:putative ABC transport system permease protein [Lachnospiraceae bacterium XBB2008]|nr:putative ABC transport system permease protein [Lachnospiraceae bacterium XBB2008]
MKNPLIRRIPRELISDWHKYLVIIVFLVLMIGLVSGMYVGHDSMLASIDQGKEELKLEDGSFELAKKASPELLADISTGRMADVRQYYLDKGMEEADAEVSEAIEKELDEQVRNSIEEAVRAQCEAYGITDEDMILAQIDDAVDENYENAIKEARESDEFTEASDEAYEEAHDAVREAVDDEWDEISEEYGLDDEGFSAVRVSIYEDFYRDESEDADNDGTQDATIRVFRSDTPIDQASFNEGRAPGTGSEIAIDRMHADNMGVHIGDTITVGGKEFTVVGLLSYVHYLTLHESNTDLMFDAFGFDVGMVTPEAFDSLRARIHYNYAYVYETEPADKIEQADTSESFLKALITQTLVHDNEIKSYLPEYLRQASNFAPADIEGDSSATSILCYILIAVIAFIFAITISNTIDKEAPVIGTLRASGYSKKELAVHYMSLPVVVTLIGAVIGNVLGYTAFRGMAVSLYYESYSLPSCHLVWSPTALVKTTLIPLVLMFFINLIVIVKKLQLSPLQFLRHDLTKTRHSKARRLPAWSFLRRFRLRIMFQNMPNYVVLIFGVIFIELMMCFAFGLPDSLDHYGSRAPEMVFADYQYMLMGYKDSDGNVIETSEDSAERFSAKTLMYPKETGGFRSGMGSGGDESVTVYGISPDSSYVSMPAGLPENNVYLSSAFMQKFGLTAGDTIALHEEYENKTYEFTVYGTIDYEGGIAAFMDQDAFFEVFDQKPGEFTGYFSRNEITDIDEQDIATVITAEDISKVASQLDHSLGGIVNAFKYVLIVLAAAMIYLLAKIIIERNERSISMVKILGFKNTEIGSLYIIPTAAVVVACAVAGFAAGYFLMIEVFKVFMLQMDGYFAYYMTPASMILSVVYLLFGYLAVSVVDYIRIRRIPLNEALKNME